MAGVKAEDEPWETSLAVGHWVGENLNPLECIDLFNPIGKYHKNDFYHVQPAQHMASSPIHLLKSTPGPLPVLGASTASAFARRLRKRCGRAAQM